MNPDGKVIIECDLETMKFEQKMKTLENQLERETNKGKELENQLSEVNKQLSKMTDKDIGGNKWNKLVDKAVSLENQINNNVNKIDEIKGKIDILNFKQLNDSAEKNGKILDNISKKMSNITKKVLKWGLAMFSIRTIYTMASRAAQSYLSVNEELSNKLQSVWIGIGSFLEPIISKVSDILLKAVAYVNYFIKALTGIDYVARANAKALKKQTQAQKGLNKEMAVFDEMTKLGAKDETVSTPTIELPELDENKMQVIDKIVEKIQLAIDKIKEWKKSFEELGISIDPVMALLGVGGLLGILFGKGGLVGAITAVILAIKGLADMFDGDLAKSVQGMFELLGAAGLIGILTGNAGLGWAIASVVLAFEGLNLMLNGDTTDAIEGIILLFGAAGLIGILTGKKGLAVAITSVIVLFQGLHDLLTGDVDDACKGFIEIVTGGTGMVVALSLLRGGAKAGLLGILTPLNLAVIGFIALAAGAVAVIKSWDNMSTLQKVVSVLGLIAIGAASAAAAVGALQSAWSLGIAAAAIVAGTVAIASSISSANKKAKEGIPKLAVGGIVNRPGAGVPVGGAIAGERGAEGVIPLTDSQQMALLGEAIGKYITINANITNTMNGRVISRELQKVQNESNFAFNR